MVEGSFSREQLVKKNAQAIDVGARIDVQATHFGLLWTHVCRSPDELLEPCEHGLISELDVGGRFGDAKVDYLGDGHAIMQRDEDIRGLDVAMDDSFLMRVLNGMTNLDE